MLDNSILTSQLKLIESSTQSLTYFTTHGNENFKKDSLYIKNFFPLCELNSELREFYSWGETRLYLINNLISDNYLWEAKESARWMIAVLDEGKDLIHMAALVNNEELMLNTPHFLEGQAVKLNIKSFAKKSFRIVLFCTSDYDFKLIR